MKQSLLRIGAQQDLAKVLNIWDVKLFKVSSHDLESVKSHDIELLSKRSREFNENRVGLKGGDWLLYIISNI